MIKKIQLSPKTKKIINIVVNVVCGVILVIALILAVSMINSRRKGYREYTEIFGSAYLAVETDSMEPAIKPGDLIKVKTISAKDASSLKVGDIITFLDSEILNGQRKLNTHRIQEIKSDNNGIYFITHGDHNPDTMTETVRPNELVGLYKGRAGGIGKVASFMGTSAGFFVFVVLPTLIIVIIAAVNFVMVFIKEKKVQTVAAVQEKEDERERIRQELLAEMQANNNSAEAPQTPAAEPVEMEEPQKEEPQSEEVVEENNAPSEDNKTETDKEEK